MEQSSSTKGRRVAVAASAALLLLLAGCGRTSNRAERSVSGPERRERAAAQGTPAEAEGRVVYLTGTVTVDGVPARIGQPVRSGGVVTTGPDGSCEVVFAGQNIVQLRANSIAVLTFAGLARGIQVESGTLAAVIRGLTAQADAAPFQVDTPTAVAGVRGTALFVKVLDPGRTYLCLCNGTLTLQDNRGGNHATVTAAHHCALEYRRDGERIVTRSAPLSYHTDSEMEGLAARIGSTIDWSRAGEAH